MRARGDEMRIVKYGDSKNIRKSRRINHKTCRTEDLRGKAFIAIFISYNVSFVSPFLLLPLDPSPSLSLMIYSCVLIRAEKTYGININFTDR